MSNQGGPWVRLIVLITPEQAEAMRQHAVVTREPVSIQVRSFIDLGLRQRNGLSVPVVAPVAVPEPLGATVAPTEPPVAVTPPPVAADEDVDRTGLTSRQKVKRFQELWNDAVDFHARGKVGKMRDLPKANSATQSGRRLYQQVVEYMTNTLLPAPAPEDIVADAVMAYWMKLPFHDEGKRKWTWVNFVPNYEKHRQAVLDSNSTIAALWEGRTPPVAPESERPEPQKLCFKCSEFFPIDAECPRCRRDPDGGHWYRDQDENGQDKNPAYWTARQARETAQAAAVAAVEANPLCPDCQTHHGAEDYCAFDEDALL